MWHPRDEEIEMWWVHRKVGKGKASTHEMQKERGGENEWFLGGSMERKEKNRRVT